MANTLQLDKTGVFILNAPESAPENGNLLYAPLAGAMMSIPPEDYDPLTNSIINKPEYEELLQLPQNLHVDRFAHQTPDDLVRFSLIPTFKCNFSCAYCYSAKGRNTKTLTKPVLDTALNYFFSDKRSKRKDRYVSIVGGGEPLLAWDEITRYAINRIRELEEENGLEVQLGITTNGSLITEEMADIFIEKRVRVAISFEILPEIQNIHRKHYETVKEKINYLLSRGIIPVLRMTVTPHNVNRLAETVEECANVFPGIHTINIEYVIDKTFFPNNKSLEEFFNAFTRSFFEAVHCGKQHNIRVNSSLYQNMKVLADRFCSCDFSLTPDGYVTACHRFTSPQEQQFRQVAYGQIGTEGIEISQERFKALMAYNVYREEKCSNCPVQWHCGGACLSLAYNYNADFLNIICRFKQNFLAYYLHDKLAPTEEKHPRNEG